MQTETLELVTVWNGTHQHNGGLLMAAAEDKPMAKELITKGDDGWGFETLDGRKAGFPSRDAARAARKEWMAAPQEKQEQEMETIAPAPVVEQSKVVETKQVAPPPANIKANGTHVKVPTPVMPSGRKRVTPDEVTAVLNLRAAGMSFQRIEAELGWDDFHGCKARRIVLDAAAAHALAAKHDTKGGAE